MATPCYNLPMRKKPVGSKRINHNGYVQIKMRDGERRWHFEHRVVWEQKHGPIPKGHFIHHKNEIKTDNRLENLALCSSNSEHLKKFHREQSSELGRRLGQQGKGKKKSLEHAANISKGLKDKPKSENHRWALSASRKGKTPNINYTPELRARMSAKRHSRIELTSEQKQEIIRHYASGIFTQEMLAEEFGVTRSAISKIVCKDKF